MSSTATPTQVRLTSIGPRAIVPTGERCCPNGWTSVATLIWHPSERAGIMPTGTAFARKCHTCKWQPCPRAATPTAWPCVTAPCGQPLPQPGYGLAAGDRLVSKSGRSRPPLQVAWPWVAALAMGMSAGGCPTSRCLCYENAVRMRKIVLRDSISSHVV
ncbi:hypothetical protein B296_00037423 [Ensete ventricosum]|uniref:Uncharacterized protein n=1 Tax=Ensete ventricosum TaxID=4639 RepID=A0A426X8Y1_ENSVE|nr:hypothetical protein B296_00037423 [Ensete ventricosum]